MSLPKGTMTHARLSSSDLTDHYYHATGALEVIADFAATRNPSLNRLERQMAGLAALEFFWDRDYVLISSAEHLGGRTRLGMLGLITGAMIALTIGAAF